MAFKRDDMVRRGPELWTYRTTDSIATVIGSGYLNGAAGLVEAGDRIFVSVLDSLSSTSPTATDLAQLRVDSVVSGVVSVTDASAGGSITWDRA